MQGRQFILNKDEVALPIKIKAHFIGFCYDAANLLLGFFAYILWPRNIKSPKKICVCRIGNIGDIICSIPAFIAVRKLYPGAHITLLTSPGAKNKPGAKELFNNPWFIDKLWIYYTDEIKDLKFAYRFAKKLQAESFDLFIFLPQELITVKTLLRNLFFIKLCKVKKAVGFELSTIKTWVREQSTVYQFDNEVDRLANLLKRWSIPVSGEIDYDLPIPESIKKSASNIINKYKIKKENVFGFMPGASYEANQWPLDNFIEVGKFILKNYSDSQIIIFGGSGDIVNGEYIKSKIKSASVFNLCGKTSLLETAFIINNLKLLISNNTGLMHMAALAGIKTIAIFFANELNGKWFPSYGDNVKLLIKMGIEKCDGNYYKGCPHDYNCLKATITPKEVSKEIVEMVKNE